MNFANIFVFALLSTILSSCNMAESLKLKKDDYLIFGWFAGECLGEGCIETFKLTDTQLFEDTKDLYPSANRTYDFVEMDNEKFEQAADLVGLFPNAVAGQCQSYFWLP